MGEDTMCRRCGHGRDQHDHTGCNAYATCVCESAWGKED